MAASQKVLLLGGHGKVALKLTPLLLQRSWHVTSVIRNPDHQAEIQALSKGHPGKLDVIVESLDEVKTAADAKKVLDKVNPSIVVWSAGMLLLHFSFLKYLRREPPYNNTYLILFL